MRRHPKQWLPLVDIVLLFFFVIIHAHTPKRTTPTDTARLPAARTNLWLTSSFVKNQNARMLANWNPRNLVDLNLPPFLLTRRQSPPMASVRWARLPCKAFPRGTGNRRTTTKAAMSRHWLLHYGSGRACVPCRELISALAQITCLTVILLRQRCELAVGSSSSCFGLHLCDNIGLVHGALHYLLLLRAQIFGEIFVQRGLLLL